MSAKDYVIAEGCLGTLYLTKTLKNQHRMSEDRRVITDEECIGCAYHFLKKRCEELNDDTIVVTNGNGEQLFEMKLLKKEEEL